MTPALPPGQVKACCAAFYQRDWVRLLLGDVVHPGGLVLTDHLAEALALTATDRVLDVASGRGAAAVHLASRVGCHVTGVDYAAEGVAAARALATARGVAQRTDFRQGDAEGLDFADGAFDAVLSECSFCLFPDKATAAAEMARVVRPGGRLGLADITRHGPLPEDARTLLSWVACIAGAVSPAAYTATLQAAGFVAVAIEDHRDALLDLVDDVRRKLLGVELAVGLGKLDLGDVDLEAGQRLARHARRLVEDGVVGYALITARRGV